jgi:two-component system, cell cycle sensor histidine kinase and response regulator CckA
MPATPCHEAEASRFPPATPTNFPATFPHRFAAELLPNTGSSGKGTGLGSTVYGIVHQFGGQIQLDSPPGAGTRFRIFFPVAEPCSTKPAPAPTPQEQQQQPQVAPSAPCALAILFVDDEVALRSAVAEYLRSSGHQVLESQSALDALELARHHSGPIGILLTDVVMPELRGPALVRQV